MIAIWSTGSAIASYRSVTLRTCFRGRSFFYHANWNSSSPSIINSVESHSAGGVGTAVNCDTGFYRSLRGEHQHHHFSGSYRHLTVKAAMSTAILRRRAAGAEAVVSEAAAKPITSPPEDVRRPALPSIRDHRADPSHRPRPSPSRATPSPSTPSRPPTPGTSATSSTPASRPSPARPSSPSPSPAASSSSRPPAAALAASAPA